MGRGYSSGVEYSSTMQKPQFNPWYYKKRKKGEKEGKRMQMEGNKEKRNLTFYREPTRRITLSGNDKARHKEMTSNIAGILEKTKDNCWDRHCHSVF